MFYDNSLGQPESLRQVYKSWVANSVIMPPAILIVCTIVIGIVSWVFGMPGESMALDFISNGTEPIAMLQIFFLAVAYTTGPLCLVLDPGKIRVSVGHLSTHVLSSVSELISLFAPLRGDVRIPLTWSQMPAMRPVRLELAAIPTTSHTPGESSQLE